MLAYCGLCLCVYACSSVCRSMCICVHICTHIRVLCGGQRTTFALVSWELLVFLLRLGVIVSLLAAATKYTGKSTLREEEYISFKFPSYSIVQEGGFQWQEVKTAGHMSHGEWREMNAWLVLSLLSPFISREWCYPWWAESSHMS